MQANQKTPLDVAGVVSLMQSMLTPESFERWRTEFPDERISEFVEEYADYDRADGWEDEIRDDPDRKGYVMSEDYWQKNFANEPEMAARYRHGYSDDDAVMGIPETKEPSLWDFDPEELRHMNMRGYNSSLNSAVQNAHIEQTPQGTWVVRGDSERFGKNAILYEHYSKSAARSYLHKLTKSQSGKNMAKSHYNASKGDNLRVRTQVNCSRRSHAITCLNCAVSEVTVPEDFVRTESRAFDLLNIVQNELWDEGMDVTIKQIYRPQPSTFRFSYVITDPNTTDERVDASIEEIVAKLVSSGFYPEYGVDLDSSDEVPTENTEISINLFDNFPRKKLWECMNWLEHEMWAEGWDASIESADQPKPDQISFDVAHPASISAEDVDDFVKDRVLEFIENDYRPFEYPENDPRSKFNSNVNCEAEWISGDGNAFYLEDDDTGESWAEPENDQPYKIEKDEYGNEVVRYKGYIITGNANIGYVALSPYGTWSPQSYISIADAVREIEEDIASRS